MHTAVRKNRGIIFTLTFICSQLLSSYVTKENVQNHNRSFHCEKQQSANTCDYRRHQVPKFYPVTSLQEQKPQQIPCQF